MESETKESGSSDLRVAELERRLRETEIDRDWWKMQYQTTILRDVPSIERALTRVCSIVATTAGLPAPDMGVNVRWATAAAALTDSDDGGDASDLGAPESTLTFVEEPAPAATETDKQKADRLVLESAKAFGSASNATTSAPATIDIVPLPLATVAPEEPIMSPTAVPLPNAGTVDSSSALASPSPVVVPVPIESTDEADGAEQLYKALMSGVGTAGESGSSPVEDREKKEREEREREEREREEREREDREREEREREEREREEREREEREREEAEKKRAEEEAAEKKRAEEERKAAKKEEREAEEERAKAEKKKNKKKSAKKTKGTSKKTKATKKDEYDVDSDSDDLQSDVDRSLLDNAYGSDDVYGSEDVYGDADVL